MITGFSNVAGFEFTTTGVANVFTHNRAEITIVENNFFIILPPFY